MWEKKFDTRMNRLRKELITLPLSRKLIFNSLLWPCKLDVFLPLITILILGKDFWLAGRNAVLGILWVPSYVVSNPSWRVGLPCAGGGATGNWSWFTCVSTVQIWEPSLLSVLQLINSTFLVLSLRWLWFIGIYQAYAFPCHT